MYSVILTQAARSEVIEAHDWYEAEAPGLGSRFRDALDTLIDRMSSSPRQFPIVFRNVRRAIVRRFPYCLFFIIEDETDSLLVIACFHASRDPVRWQERVD